MSDSVNKTEEERISLVTSPVTIVATNWACATAHALINRQKLERAKKRRKMNSNKDHIVYK